MKVDLTSYSTAQLVTARQHPHLFLSIASYNIRGSVSKPGHISTQQCTKYMQTGSKLALLWLLLA